MRLFGRYLSEAIFAGRLETMLKTERFFLSIFFITRFLRNTVLDFEIELFGILGMVFTRVNGSAGDTRLYCGFRNQRITYLILTMSGFHLSILEKDILKGRKRGSCRETSRVKTLAIFGK